MNIMMYILGSGVMENPTLLWFTMFLCAAIIFGLLGWQAFERSEKKSMFIVSVVLFVAAVICFFVCLYHFTKILPSEKPYPRVEKMEFENHEYLIFKDKFSSDVIHNPDCECRKLFRPLKEK